MPRTAPRRRRPRSGFTLVELLVVITIIGLLVALLIPAIASAVRTAKSAAVQAEINQLAQALADFKGKFGDYPPSRVALNENGSYSLASGGAGVATANGASADVQLGLLYQRTVNAFRKFWPRVVLTPGSTVAYWYDFDGDGNMAYNSSGVPTKTYVLQGHECLVFFLGGIPIKDATTGAILGMSGFSKDPTNPFKYPKLPAGGANRNPPYYEFSVGRLLLNAQGMPSYTDSLNPPPSANPGYYAYFSSNNSMGYDPNDVNNPGESDANGVSPLLLKFGSTQPVYDSSGSPATSGIQGMPYVTASPSPNPYTTSAPAGGPNVTYQNAQSFQIISPGADGVYGVGGFYAANSQGQPLPAQGNLSNTADRTIENDNLTNFHNGRLQ